MRLMQNLFDRISRRLWFRPGDGLETRADRLRAQAHFHLVDHAYLRTLWTNMFQIAPGVWRANQPSARRLRAWKKQGIRSVLNLRGATREPHYLMEAAACEALGLELVNIKFAARSLFPAKRYLELLDIFETIERPFVMHCKSGADRAGLASALYLIHIEGKTPREAMAMMGLRYIHLNFTKTGILDAFLRAYDAAYQANGIKLRRWLEEEYDRDKIYASYKPRIDWG